MVPTAIWAVKLTTDKFYRINGGSTQLEGVISDIVIKNQYSYIDMGRKTKKTHYLGIVLNPLLKKSGNLNNYDFVVSQSAKRLKDNPYTQLLEQQARRIEAPTG